MAIVSHGGITKSVANLAARDAITPKPDGLVITVLDSTGDPIAGSGVATYKWVTSTSSWLLLADDDAVSYTSAEKIKLSGIEESAAADQNSSEVPYDNTSSGLTATNVKDALDEVAAASGAGATTLDSLTDVAITTPTLGNAVTYNGSSWVNAMQDAQYTNITDTGGHYSGTTVEAALQEVPTLISSATNMSIKDLSDVYSSMTPTDGQLLTYDTTNGWQAETLNYLAGSLEIGTDLVVDGDLTVTGTSFTINTETVDLGNNFMTLNATETGSPTQDCGIVVERGTAINVAVQWDETLDYWTLTNDGSVYNKIVTDGNLLTQPVINGETGWNDITSEIIVRGAASAAPTWDQMGSYDMYGYNFGVGKKAYSRFHIRHDYMPGGEIYIHVHWTTSGTDTNDIHWKIEYTVAKGHNQSTGGDFFPLNSVTLIDTPVGTAWRHMVTEMSSSISLTNAEVDALILVSVERVTNGATDNGDDIFGLTVDCHYQTDRIATVNRAPNFYGA